MKRLILLMLITLPLFVICQQKARPNSIGEIFNGLFSWKEIPFRYKDSIININNSDSVYAKIYQASSLLELRGSTSDSVELTFNGKRIEEISKGNADYEGGLRFDAIQKEEITFFYLNNISYCLIPLEPVGCSGSFCRVSLSILLVDNGMSVRCFFFAITENNEGCIFKIDNTNNIVFFDITNSFTSPESFAKYSCVKRGCMFYRVAFLKYNSSKGDWRKVTKNGKDCSAVVKVKSEFDLDGAKVVSIYK